MTNMSDYRARYYDPQIGRFLSEDPVRFWGGIDFYKYVENNPQNSTDPSGKWPWYGNWCGPNWTGGRVEEYNPHHDIEYYKPPIDGADMACMGHDICYSDCRQNFKCDKQGRRACMVKCNHTLAKEARQSGVDNGRVNLMILVMEGNNMPSSVLDDMVGSDDKSCGCKSSK
jgi:hypothetical protein